jgi:ferredoxin
MQTTLADFIRDTAQGQEAEAILRSCVHCGFCNATCPTYQLLGDELDGPRGRIYLMKQMLEGQPVTAVTRLHLDRCLTCRNCETTCPSGVQYGRLIDIGRDVVERLSPRPAAERLLRAGLRKGLQSPALFGSMLKLGQSVRGCCRQALREHVPATLPGCSAAESGDSARTIPDSASSIRAGHGHIAGTAPHAGAGRLRATGDGAGNQRRRQTRARSPGHRSGRRAEGRLLRRHRSASGGAGCRQSRDAAQHRRLVAVHQGWRRRASKPS